jgi:hypothetical protein
MVTNEDDMMRVAARLKSYTGSAVLVFFLYLLFYIPGLIVNVMYYREAKRMQRMAGQGLPGVGCLLAELIVMGAGLLLVIITMALAMFLTSTPSILPK